MKKFLNTFTGLFLSVLTLLLFVHPLLAADDPVLSEIKTLLESYYVDDLNWDSFQAESPEALIAELGDPHSQYLKAEEMEEFIGAIEGEYAGIGVYLSSHILPEGVEISGLIPASPAEEAGMEIGDIIVRVDRKSLAGLSLDTVLEILLGPTGTQVEIEVKRGEIHRQMVLKRQDIKVPLLSCTKLDFHIAYINVDSFGDTAYRELLQVIADCRQAGVNKWIIDLQGNPGGYIDRAVDIAGIFVGSEIVTVLAERAGINGYQAQDLDMRVYDPVLVLIDENSASASEILAGALKDYHQGVLLGHSTYGKGTAQSIFPLANGDYLKLTTARFYSPLGFPIDGVGVEPDLPLSSPNILKAAELLLSDPPDGGAGSFELLAQGHQFLIDLNLARSPEYWGVWGEIAEALQYLPAYRAQGEEDYCLLTSTQLKHKGSWYYPQAQDLGRVEYDDNSREIWLYLSPADSWALNNDSIKLCPMSTGVQISCQVIRRGNLIRIQPEEELLPGEYWLMIKGLKSDTYLAQIGVQQ